MYFLSVSAVQAWLLQRSRLPLAGCCQCVGRSGLDTKFAVLAAAGPQHLGTATFCTQCQCNRISLAAGSAAVSGAAWRCTMAGCPRLYKEEEEEQTEEEMMWRRGF